MLLNQALTMELRGRGRGDGCSEAGSLGAGMVGAREGQKRGRKGRTRALISVEDGGTNEDIDEYGECGAHSVAITKCVLARKHDRGKNNGERRGSKDGFDRKQ